MTSKLYVNQEYLMKVAPEIKIDEAIILNYLIGFYDYGSEAVENEMIDDFVWINYGKAINDLPILHLKSSKSIKDKMEKLETLGFINLRKEIIKGRDRKYFNLNQLCNQLRRDLNVLREDGNFNFDFCDMMLVEGISKTIAIEMSFNKEFIDKFGEKITKIFKKTNRNNHADYFKKLYFDFKKINE